MNVMKRGPDTGVTGSRPTLGHSGSYQEREQESQNVPGPTKDISESAAHGEHDDDGGQKGPGDQVPVCKNTHVSTSAVVPCV